MYPNNGDCAIDLTQFPVLEGVLDVIYNPAKTQLLLEAEKLGLPHQNGLWMLVAQAKEAAEYFGGTPLPDTIIESIYQKLSNQMQNIILIGMPGCGKSTIASLLAQYTGRKVVDSDLEIVKLAGKSIPDIFADDGETVFRAYETKVLSELGKQSQLILATGGGCVTQTCNYPLLHQNGNIFWLKRDLDQLSTEGRPLSQTTRLNKMYEIRKAMYEAFADYTIDNNGTLENTVNQIISVLGEKI
jgi:shikimate dehydrogenase